MVFRKARRLLVSVLMLQITLGLCSVLPNISWGNRLRGLLVSPFLGSCGRGFMLAKGAVINMPDKLFVGNDVYIAHDAWINATGTIRLEDGVVISPRVVMASTRHRYRDGRVLLRESDNLPITIRSGAWVASNCVITMGTTVGAGCVVGACSAVTKDLPGFYLCAGVPAQPIKALRQ